MRVVPYQYSTSNRNQQIQPAPDCQLFLISILHQTATKKELENKGLKLFLISILHQTATCTPAEFHQVWLFLISILHQTATL